MIVNIIALCIFIFGAYAYGSVVVLTLRHGSPIWSNSAAPGASRLNIRPVGLAMYFACTVWFVLHSIIAFRFLMGDPTENDLIDLAALELVFAFPALIFHTVLLETEGDEGRTPGTIRISSAVLVALYAAGAAMALYFPAAILGFVDEPRWLNAAINASITALFSVSCAACIWLMATRRRTAATPDQRRLRTSLIVLFVAMIVLFFMLTFMRDQRTLMAVLNVLVRTTPLLFLIVSVYFENRIEFYDLVVKRGVIMLLSLLLLASALTIGLQWIDQMPGGAARPWLVAVGLLPVAMLLPWLHNRVGRALDRLWFGRDFTAVEAVKHVLASMQQATDERSLVAATEATLSEMFRRRIAILLEGQAVPQRAMTTDIRTGISPPLRLAVIDEPGTRPMLSEDIALLRSLGSVFGFMLENVRLQRKRQEQEQVANELRLQTSRSELKALRAQINPHFLFNALNAIASLIHTDPTRADAAVEQLAEVFRYTLRRSDQEWAPLEQELAFARAYLDVEQARFGKRLEYSIEADAALGRAHVPSMLLQTLVENAVKHGIARLRTPGRIDVRAAQTNGQLTLEVRDTGPGMEVSVAAGGTDHLRQGYGGQEVPPSSTGENFGLRSVRDRLSGHFGNQASLELVREHAQTVARIRLPLVSEPATAFERAR